MKLRRWTCPDCKAKNVSDLDELRKQTAVAFRGERRGPAEFVVRCQSCSQQHVIVVNEDE